jgi:hypothetical protein
MFGEQQTYTIFGDEYKLFGDEHKFETPHLPLTFFSKIFNKAIDSTKQNPAIQDARFSSVQVFHLQHKESCFQLT